MNGDWSLIVETSQKNISNFVFFHLSFLISYSVHNPGLWLGKQV